MAYASKFNPDALPAHAEPEEAAQILSRRTDSDSNTPAPATTATPPKPTPATSPVPTQGSDYSNRPPPPIPTIAPLQTQHQAQRPGGPGYHRNTLTGGGRSPMQSPYSPAGNTRLGPGAPPSLQAGIGPNGPYQRRASSPSASGDSALYPLFKAVDQRGTGQLSELELSHALKNGDYTEFDPATVRMMIRMHDHDRSGTIGFTEFCALWNFLGSWRTLFDRFDEDKSGYISYDEYSNALVQFGYNLTPQFVTMLYRMYDKRGNQAMSFDLFVQSCLTLKRLTDVFKRFDTDRDGFITLGFEDFLTEILQSR